MENKNADWLAEHHIISNANTLIETLMKNEILTLEDIQNLYYDCEENYKDFGYDSPEAMRDDGADFKEIFEWYVITPQLAQYMLENNFPVIVSDNSLSYDHGLGYYYGRTTTGQYLTMDNEFIELADKIVPKLIGFS